MPGDSAIPLAPAGRPERLLGWAWVFAGVGAATGVALQLGLLLPTRGQVTTWESATLEIAWQVRSGQSAYRPVDEDPLYVAIYGPAYFHVLGFAGRWLQADRLAMITIARVYSTASIMAALLCVGWMSWPGGTRRWAAAAIVVPLGLAPSTAICFLASARPDGPTLLWSVLAVLLARNPRPWRVVAAALLAVFALLHKPTAVAAPLAIAIWLAQTGRWRQMLVFVAAAGGSLVAACLAINAACGGQFFEHQRLVASVPMRWEFLQALLAAHYLWLVLLGLVAAGAVVLWYLRAARPGEPMLQLAVTYAACSLGVAVVTSSRGGSGHNYFLELFVVLGWCVALVLQDSPGRQAMRLRRGQYLLSVLLLANPFLWLLPLRVSETAYFRGVLDGMTSSWTEDRAWLASLPKPVLCLDAWLAYCAGVHGHLSDPTIYAFLTHADPDWDPLTPRVEQRYFARVVSFGPPGFVAEQSYQGVPDAPPQLLEAIRAKYWPAERKDLWFAYRPRTPSDTLPATRKTSSGG